MKCVMCGKEIETTDRRVHYCSEECRKKGMRNQMVEANRKRRANDPAYMKRTTERALERYYERKYERYTEIAKELIKVCGDVEAMVTILEENCRLRH